LLRFWRATINTRNGLAFAIRSEQAVREELAALALSLPMAWLVGATTMRRVELIAVVVLVLVVELLNTAIEKLGRCAGHGRPVLAVRPRRTHGRVLKHAIGIWRSPRGHAIFHLLIMRISRFAP
jgi:hypothetical protein